MPDTVVYLKAQQNAEVMEKDVYVRDIASVYCSDSNVKIKIKELKIYQFHEEDKKRQVISVLKVIELIEKECPEVMVFSIGENETLIEFVSVNKYKGSIQTLKLIFVALISFFGTGFTIMAFHNDININKLFARVYEMVMGYPSDGYSILELSYSVGLALGIMLFFNHIGGKKLTGDPTPIEVEMRIYEGDVNQSLMEAADREGKTIDVS